MPVDISEYARSARDNTNTAIPAGQEPRVVQQQVAVGGGSTQSSAFDLQTTLIRVHTDVAVRIEIGANPTAGAASKRMAANSTEYFGVQGGHKLATITTT